jgi:hypothetical protein
MVKEALDVSLFTIQPLRVKVYAEEFYKRY